MTTLHLAIRARWVDGNVYVRKEDLLAWFDQEARAQRRENLHEAATQTESIARSLRKVRAS